MSFQEGWNPNEPPPYDEDFNYWRRRMECFLGSVDIDYMLILKKPSQNSELNKNVSKIICNILPNNIICRLEKYKNAYELWTQLIKLHETPMELEDQVKVKSRLESDPTEKPAELGVALKVSNIYQNTLASSSLKYVHVNLDMSESICENSIHDNTC